jgi:hypothetical protein
MVTMGRMGKDRGQINVNLPADILAVIDERRTRLTITRSKFMANLLDDWKLRGYPGINEADRAMLILKGETPKDRRKAA